MLGDIRIGFRLLTKDLPYAATAILTLAICIAANTAAATMVLENRAMAQRKAA